MLFDLAIASLKLGVNISVASPSGYTIPPSMLKIIQSSSQGVSSPGKLTQTSVPEEAIKDADILVTDTWVSMGQEEESAKRLKAFAGYQITNQLAKRGGAKEGWKFMHCLPRHPEEVADEVFYSPRSLVFPEAENRLYSAIGELAFSFNLEVDANALIQLLWRHLLSIRGRSLRRFIKRSSREWKCEEKPAQSDVSSVSAFLYVIAVCCPN